MRLRRGKSRPRGSHSIGISETTAPYSAMRGDQRDRLGRIGPGVAAGEHADRAGLERGDMGAQVDAAREAGDDDVARLPEPARQPVGEGEAGGGGVARADDRDRGLLQRLLAAAQRQDRRRGIDLAQRRGIVGLAERDEAHAELARRRRARARSPRASATRIGRRAPPRRARSGSASSAARAPPQSLISARKVRGPTFSERISRSQSNRCSSERRGVGGLLAMAQPLPDLRFRSREEPARYWRCA